ncbi:MAG TPA: DUF4177 domain-containing protein [Pyrinomonadaceae bacterium]
MLQKWEYRTLKLEEEGWLNRQVDFEFLDTKLNNLGKEGWELVNVIYVVNSGMIADSVIAFLKRPA